MLVSGWNIPLELVLLTFAVVIQACKLPVLSIGVKYGLIICDLIAHQNELLGLIVWKMWTTATHFILHNRTAGDRSLKGHSKKTLLFRIIENQLRLLNRLSVCQTLYECVVEVTVWLTTDIVVDWIMNLTITRLAVQIVCLFDVLRLFQVLVPKTVRSMIVVATARLMNCVFISLYFCDCLVKWFFDWPALR